MQNPITELFPNVKWGYRISYSTGDHSSAMSGYVYDQVVEKCRGIGFWGSNGSPKVYVQIYDDKGRYLYSQSAQSYLADKLRDKEIDHDTYYFLLNKVGQHEQDLLDIMYKSNERK